MLTSLGFNSSPNLVLTGFMGTGKTCVSQYIAQIWGQTWLDTDIWIMQHTGKSIPQIFCEHGESAFREYEKKACQSIPPSQGWIIATGGGTLLDLSCRELLSQGGIIICLMASPHVIQARLQNAQDRPLFNDHWLQLYQQRLALYEQFVYRINTDDLTIEETAQQVMEMYLSLRDFCCLV